MGSTSNALGMPARLHPFVVIAVVTGQIGVAQFPQRGVEGHGESSRQNGLRNVVRECLAFVFILLAMTFEPVAEDLVEEHRTRPAREDRGAGVRVDRGRAPQRLQVGDHAIDGAQHGLVVR